MRDGHPAAKLATGRQPQGLAGPIAGLSPATALSLQKRIWSARQFQNYPEESFITLILCRSVPSSKRR
jgi:hypothetical protein